jgi:trans-aconitate 2-methyltransferase
MPEKSATIEFYDTQAKRKLRDFVYYNKRLEQGWQTIAEWAGSASRILEVGCGVGSICWRMGRRFPKAEVVGIDYSPGNLDIANRVFERRNVKFVLTSGTEYFSLGRFDLIAVMDVYEHVERTERAVFHENLRNSLRDEGRVILTVPTPRHLAWLREHDAKEIQPIDEDITPEVLSALANDLGRDLLMYREVNIWRRGDYAHAVIGLSQFPESVPHASKFPGLAFMDRRMRRKLVRNAGFDI